MEVCEGREPQCLGRTHQRSTFFLLDLEGMRHAGGLVPSGEVPCSATGGGGDGEPPLLGHIPPDSSGRQAELGWQARCHRLLFCPRALVDFLK